MNYKQTELFNEKKAMTLIAMAHYSVDCDEQGIRIPIKQLEKHFGIKGTVLYRVLDALEKDLLICCSHKGYEAGKYSRNWIILDKADEIINDKDNLYKFYNIINKNYKSNNEYRYSNTICYRLESDVVAAQDTVVPKSEGGNIWYNNNIDIHLMINNLINNIYSLVILNNSYSNITNSSSLRLIPVLKRKKVSIELKGRVSNALCNSKSNEEGKIYRTTDKRPTRQKMLEIYGYGNYKKIFDIKSQIPRLTYILQGGSYDDIGDFYKIRGIDRANAKKWSMSCYFGKSSKMEAWHQLRTFYHEEKIRKENWKKEHQEVWNKYFGLVWEHTRGLITPIGTEIFLWTSYWEQLIIKEAREQLIVHLLNVYDAFYSDREDILDDLQRIVKETSVTLQGIYKNNLIT